MIRVRSVNIGTPQPGLSTYGVSGIDKKPHLDQIPCRPISPVRLPDLLFGLHH